MKKNIYKIKIKKIKKMKMKMRQREIETELIRAKFRVVLISSRKFKLTTSLPRSKLARTQQNTKHSKHHII